MTDKPFRYVFGPVISRRLGRSLGIDVLPFKTCTYDCIYCQLGPTTNRTVERKEYVPLEDVLAELRQKLDTGVKADFISIVGSGEPTLYAKLGPLVAGIKAMTPVPVAVVTNGSLLWDPDVQEALLDADVVVPSLDAGTAPSFLRINRPHLDITFEKMVEGLVAFRQRFAGQIWLEVFLLGGAEAEAEVARLAAHIGRIRPDRVQLNTVARPAPGSEVVPVPREDMERFAAMLGGEVIAHYETDLPPASVKVSAEDVLAVIRRHPCTDEDLAHGLGISPEQTREHIRSLLQDGEIEELVRDDGRFYIAKNG